ncbi:MAG TPA: DUF6713 family protein [Coriobacteriia bacterium]
MLRLYMLDFALFAAHEMDSAYWREWDLFRLPGGEAAFVLLHVPLVFLLAWGGRELAEGRPWGDRVAALLALSGFAALFIHGGFIAAGHPEFRTPASAGLIAVMAAVSVALGYLALRRLIGGRRA